MKMDQIVGEGALELHEVAKVMEKSSSFPQLLRNWKYFANYLCVNEVSILELENQINLMTLSLRNVPRELLKLWKAEKGTAATFQVLHEAVNESGVQSIAEALKTKLITHKSNDRTRLMIQGQVKNLDDLLSEHTTPETRQRLVTQLLQYQKDETIEIFADEFARNAPKYYLLRAFTYRHEVDKKIFSSYSFQDHLFLLKSINRAELAGVIGFKPIEFSGSQLNKITVQFIILECDEDYELIRENTNKHVLVIEYKNNSFFWIKSSDKISSIRDYVSSQNSEIFDEDEMVTRITSLSSTVSLSIADSPGMGKTLVLGNLASKVKALNPNTLVLFIIFQELIQKIDSIDSSFSAFEVISNHACTNDLSKLIFQEIIGTGTYLLYLFLDGYDELQEDKMEVADSFLKYVKDMINVKVIVTTRPHLRCRLEDVLNQFSYEILPFDVSSQLEFLKKYWTNEYNAKDSDNLKKFATQCLEVLQGEMMDDDCLIAEIPLQCMMLAEVYAKDAKRASTLGVFREECLQKTTIFEMYKKLISLKFGRISRRPSSAQDTDKLQSYMNAHVHAAISLLFPEMIDKFQKCLPNYASINEETMYSIGLLEKGSTISSSRFIHRTFAEFIFAGHLVQNLMQYKSCMEFIFEFLLGWKGVNAKELNTGLRYYELKHRVIAYFVDLHLQDQKFENPPVISKARLAHINPEDVCIALSACCRHNLEHCFNFCTNILHQIDIKTSERLQNTYFVSMAHVAVSWSKNVSLLQNLLTFTKQEFGFDLSSHVHVSKLTGDISTSLHLALLNWDYNVVSFLLQKYGDEVKKIQGLLNYCVSDSGYSEETEIEEKLLTIDLLLQLNPKYLHEGFDNGMVPILVHNVHIKIIQRLVERGADVNTHDSKWGTVLHAAAIGGILSNYGEVVRWTLENGFRLINHRGQYGRTPILSAIVNLEVLTDEILKLLHVAGADFYAKDEIGGSVLEYAIEITKNPDFVKNILDYGASISYASRWKGNAAHVIVSYVKDAELALTMLKLLESRGFKAYNQKCCNDLTPLELAMKLRSKDVELINPGTAALWCRVHHGQFFDRSLKKIFEFLAETFSSFLKHKNTSI